jgi:hypothetical protein
VNSVSLSINLRRGRPAERRNSRSTWPDFFSSRHRRRSARTPPQKEYPFPTNRRKIALNAYHSHEKLGAPFVLGIAGTEECEEAFADRLLVDDEVVGAVDLVFDMQALGVVWELQIILPLLALALFLPSA